MSGYKPAAARDLTRKFLVDWPVRSNAGQTLVKYWPIAGQMLVKHWPNTGQTLVEFRSIAGQIESSVSSALRRLLPEINEFIH